MHTVCSSAGGRGARRACAGRLWLLILILVLPACTTVLTRSPIPEEEIDFARPYGIDAGGFRAWGDTLSKEVGALALERWTNLIREAHAETIRAGGPVREYVLALSGGGPDGAFGAGLLNGWSDRGDRPEFTIVTGISTGAIVALFAFLGPEYDDTVKEIYTTYTTDQLLTPAIFAALTGGTAFTDTSGYRRLIEKYVNKAVVARLAEESGKGRALLIGTTNLDAARPMVWNITRIAASGHPQARRLIHDVIQASSAIPAVFPPVIIPVETADGRRYDEMHVDGGATQQVMFFSPQLPMRRVDEAIGVPFDRRIYVVINNKLAKPYDPVRPRVLAIAQTAASSLISGSGTGDIYRIFAITQRDGIDLNVVWIPADFDKEAEEPFDPVYMRALFDLGVEYGRDGGRWRPLPPDYAPWPDEQPEPPAARPTVRTGRVLAPAS